MITLMSCDNLFQAELIKGRLESEGIDSQIINQNISTVLPYANGINSMRIQIMINEEDLKAATKQLQTCDAEQETGRITCPYCTGTNITVGLGEHKLKKMFAIFLSLFTVNPPGNLRSHYYCRDCKKEFDR